MHTTAVIIQKLHVAYIRAISLFFSSSAISPYQLWAKIGVGDGIISIMEIVNYIKLAGSGRQLLQLNNNTLKLTKTARQDLCYKSTYSRAHKKERPAGGRFSKPSQLQDQQHLDAVA